MQTSKKNKGAVLVTGASSGIGWACALKLAHAGFHVYAGVRKETDIKHLEQQHDFKLTPVLLDVTDEASITTVAQQISTEIQEPGLVGLVNNAGIAVPGPLEVLPISELRRQFEVNVIGQMAVTQALLPFLRQSHGRILNVGSVGSSMTFPYAGALSASKAALETLNTALRMELSPWNIPVILITPSTVHTLGVEKMLHDGEEFLRTLPEIDVQRYAAPFRAFLEAFGKQEAIGSPPEMIADTILHALVVKSPKPEYLVGHGSRLLPLLAHLLPTRLLDRVRLRALGISNAQKASK